MQPIQHRGEIVAGDGTRVKDFLLRGKGDRGGDVRSSHILHHSQ
ncbi:hypothetical protein QUA30_23425 [Microcoleus sp. Pol14C2]